jgi:hypothetical protein
VYLKTKTSGVMPKLDTTPLVLEARSMLARIEVALH